MRIYVVCNPGAKGAKGRKAIEGYLRALKERGADFACGTTSGLDDGAALARNAAADGFDVVAAAGGDGTINRVLNGILASGNRAARLGVLYAGTSPDFCRFHGIPWRGDEAVEALLSGRANRVDVCRIRHLDLYGKPASSHFACSANLGLGPAIAAWANRLRPSLGDFAGTASGAVSAILRGKRFSGRLLLDGQETSLDGAWNVTIGKNPRLASGLKLRAGVAPGDGSLYLFAVSGVGGLGLLAALPKAYTGAIAGDPRFTLLHGRHAAFVPDDEPPGLEFDGDPMGTAPVEVDVLPSAIELAGAGSEGGQVTKGLSD